MKLDIKDMQGKEIGSFEVADALLVRKAGVQAVHDAVRAHLAALRAGTASTLRKSEVAGSGRKPWRQKGTGRARAGYRQSPIWRGGGVAFGPHPRDYRQRIPQKVKSLAFRRALSDRLVAGEVRVLRDLVFAGPKTRHAASLLKTLALNNGALFVVDKVDAAQQRALRNLPHVRLTTAAVVHAYDLLLFPAIVATQAAMEQLCRRLEGGAR